jgi:hypothetical protein
MVFILAALFIKKGIKAQKGKVIHVDNIKKDIKHYVRKIQLHFR